MSKRHLESSASSCGSSHPSASAASNILHGTPLPKRARTLGDATNQGKIYRDTLVDKSLGDFKHYWKQAEAVAAKRDNERVFAVEVTSHEADYHPRAYIVSTLKRFWKDYSEKYTSRHFYELIQEGTPCRLYFDLEYEKSERNKELDEMIVYNHFILTTIALIQEVLSIKLEKKNFISLDSSTDGKFSCHVIVHFPNNELFPSNVAMKSFTDVLYNRLLSTANFTIYNSSGNSVTVMDPCVYSRNRSFRLFLSSKLGKSTVLKLAPYCEAYGCQTPPDYQVFFDSLIVPDRYDRFTLLRIPKLDSITLERQNPVSSRKAEERESDDEEWPPIIFNRLKSKSASEEHDDLVLGEEERFSHNAATAVVPRSLPDRSVPTEGDMPSPFPDMDDFIYSILSAFKAEPKIPRYRLLKDNYDPDRYFGILYYPSNVRYCYNIGREHKSNGTWWGILFRSRTFYQKCFDQECGSHQQRFELPSCVRGPYEEPITFGGKTMMASHSPSTSHKPLTPVARVPLAPKPLPAPGSYNNDSRISLDPANNSLDAVIAEDLAREEQQKEEKDNYYAAWKRSKFLFPI